ncbi:hypothetical protein B9479_008012 [Cryptococcus floricola]|uniref:Chromo domain-containing protein n=1 Tax=Cryptococcus floricola TaxID=2591691 RepID=A0A5D3AIL2_9TREE|nr:hypothetical protein B9479_008012 [Cryptococcus floricola]
MLSRRHLQSSRPSKQLNDKLAGPFTILHAVGRGALKLDLGREFARVHPVFNSCLLEPYRTSSIPGRPQPNRPAPDIVADELCTPELVAKGKERGTTTGKERGATSRSTKSLSVQTIKAESRNQRVDGSEILDSRSSRKAGLQYFVDFDGWGPADNSWISTADTNPDDALVLAFHRAHHAKPGYARVFPATTPAAAPITPATATDRSEPTPNRRRSAQLAHTCSH